MTTVTTETSAKDVLDDETRERMKERVDRLMGAVQKEIKNGDFRIKCVTALLPVRQLFDRED